MWYIHLYHDQKSIEGKQIEWVIIIWWQKTKVKVTVTDKAEIKNSSTSIVKSTLVYISMRNSGGGHTSTCNESATSVKCFIFFKAEAS